MELYSRLIRLMIPVLALVVLGLGAGCEEDKVPDNFNADGDATLDDAAVQTDTGTGNEEDTALPDDASNNGEGDAAGTDTDVGTDADTGNNEPPPPPDFNTVALRFYPNGNLPAGVIGAKVYVNRILVEQENCPEAPAILDLNNMNKMINLQSDAAVLLTQIPLTWKGSVMARIFFKPEGEIEMQGVNTGSSLYPITNMSVLKIRIRSLKHAAAKGVFIKLNVPASVKGLVNSQNSFVFTPIGRYDY